MSACASCIEALTQRSKFFFPTPLPSFVFLETKEGFFENLVRSAGSQHPELYYTFYIVDMHGPIADADPVKVQVGTKRYMASQNCVNKLKKLDPQFSFSLLDQLI